MTTEQDDAATATHEAAHACVGLALRLRVQRAVIDATRGGFVAFGAHPEPVAETWAWLASRGECPPAMPEARVLEHILSLLAGPAAEARAVGVPYSRGSVGAWRDVYDAEHLIAMALRARVWSNQVRAMLAVVEVAAADRVRENWNWIERTAAALLERRQLTAAEINGFRRR